MLAAPARRDPRASTRSCLLDRRGDGAARASPSPLHRAADAYLVQRGAGKTIIAGYPWFTDWGRDTFIALRGLCLAPARLDDARDILLAWAGDRLRGHAAEPLPRPRRGARVQLGRRLALVRRRGARVPAGGARDGGTPATATRAARRGRRDPRRLRAGTRYGIRVDDDGLLAAGEPGVQLTWMDAKVGDWVVTPRIGKPVEVQALWLNALAIAGASAPELAGLYRHALRVASAPLLERASAAASTTSSTSTTRPGTIDATFRPNQIFAVGGLPSRCSRASARAGSSTRSSASC